MIGVGATLNERFILETELGEGGMGTVFRATDRVLERNVAIKLLKESGTAEVAQRIRLEAQILARFVHDKIVRLYDFVEWNGSAFLVMEEVDGPSFSNRWRDLLLENRLRICGQVAEALDYAHTRGVIHRDVKPSNVLLTPGDESKLSDFGLSFVAADRKDLSGTIRGTPCYMSPEQAQGKSLDHRTDLYALGVMLYECATGDVPFIGDVMSIISQHIKEPPAPPRFMNPAISPTLDSLILSLLEKNPKKRPNSGGMVAVALIKETERERQRRLERTETLFKRSDPRIPTAPAPSERKPTADPANNGLTRTNGTGRVDRGTLRLSTTETPPSAPVGHPEGAAAPPSVSREVPRWARTGRTIPLGAYSHPVAREMLTEVLAKPIVLSPEERYLCGHYLAYLLVGSRRRGFFLRGALDARNADRARLLLAMTWLISVGSTDEAIERASAMLNDRPDVRAALNPVVVVKYLASRNTLSKRTRFRDVRLRLKNASAYARKAMLDGRGVLNPGMMPRDLDDLATIAPDLDRLDAHRVSLWNRLAEVWRQEDDFRQAVLRYASHTAHLDSVSADLWPEVVYPLIERAHWQRTFLPRHQAIWDYVLGKLLRIPMPGVRLDRMLIIAVPPEVAEQLDEDLDLFALVDDPHFADDEPSPAERPASVKPPPVYVGATIPRDDPRSEDDIPGVKEIVPLSPAEPFLFTQDVLRELWEGAMEAPDQAARPRMLHRTIPVGPYRLAVIPTGRSREAVRAVVQLMQLGKEIEIVTPAVRARDSGSRTVIAIWVYKDGSLVLVHLDFQFKERYIVWHAPNAHQFNFSYLTELKHILSNAYMQVPDKLDCILSK
jgi:serine/threonine-protein kinase